MGNFFNPSEILERFGITETNRPVLDAGCGFGTFTIPLAKMTSQKVYAVDIDENFLETLRLNGTDTIIPIKHDIFDQKLILPEKVGSILLFNILHCENPTQIIQNILPNLENDGKVYVIHWRKDIETPRGPSLNIRPEPQQIIQFFETLEFEKIDYYKEISPYHYGITFQRRVKK